VCVCVRAHLAFQLHLGSNKIGPEGAGAIADSLRDNRFLTTCDVSWCGIGAEGARVFAESLRHAPSPAHEPRLWTVLNLGGNRIGDEGAGVIARAVADGSSTLQVLKLYKNKISSVGAVALAEAVAGNASLMSLSLTNNHITMEGYLAFAAALRTNSVLEGLDLDGNEDVHSDGRSALAKEFEEALWANPALKDLGGYQLRPDGNSLDDTLADLVTRKSRYVQAHQVRIPQSLLPACVR
jgi:Ran GTPase-activating protein (RanGAP) involved in mRNA processing and transport